MNLLFRRRQMARAMRFRADYHWRRGRFQGFGGMPFAPIVPRPELASSSLLQQRPSRHISSTGDYSILDRPMVAGARICFKGSNT